MISIGCPATTAPSTPSHRVGRIHGRRPAIDERQRAHPPTVARRTAPNAPSQFERMPILIGAPSSAGAAPVSAGGAAGSPSPPAAVGGLGRRLSRRRSSLLVAAAATGGDDRQADARARRAGARARAPPVSCVTFMQSPLLSRSTLPVRDLPSTTPASPRWLVPASPLLSHTRRPDSAAGSAGLTSRARSPLEVAGSTESQIPTSPPGESSTIRKKMAPMTVLKRCADEVDVPCGVVEHDEDDRADPGALDPEEAADDGDDEEVDRRAEVDRARARCCRSTR